jgi:hypothetical protein
MIDRVYFREHVVKKEWSVRMVAKESVAGLEEMVKEDQQDRWDPKEKPVRLDSPDLQARKVIEVIEAMLALKVNKGKKVCKVMMALQGCLVWLESW